MQAGPLCPEGVGLLGGVWYFLSDDVFRHLFSASFLTGFCFDFGEVLEANMGPRIDILSILEGVFSHPNFCAIFCSFLIAVGMLES